MLNGYINNSPIRNIAAKVELFKSSTLVKTFHHTDRLVKVEIERIGEKNKFFGFGVCQKAEVELIDMERDIFITTNDVLKMSFSCGSEYTSAYPSFLVDSVTRDETRNKLNLVAFDKIGQANTIKVAELELDSYTVLQFAEAAAAKLGAAGVKVIGLNEGETCFNTSYEKGANFEGTEDLRTALNQVAEATQTIYYMDKDDYLVFKRLSKGEAALTISKDDYATLTSGETYQLTTVVSATELGDNVSASLSSTGATQYVRDNPFWDLREDVATLVDNALAAVGGLAIAQFDCTWRGNFLLEIGDKIELVTKDDSTITSFIIDDKITYTGGLKEVSCWEYKGDVAESTNPTTLGELLKQTYARVDKANKQIDLLTGQTSANKDELAALRINTDSINTTVQRIETVHGEAIEDLQGEVEELSTKITQTAENVKIEIKNELKEEGLTSVTTNTGFTFDDEGLNVTKTDSEMSTQITEDGMTVFKTNKEVLVANNQGVKALNLHATTYLIIGNNSRFEDYERDWERRTACFWIGG